MTDDKIPTESYLALVDSAHDKAKARIEELQSSLHWVIQERDDTFARMLRRAEEAEAKLAKAVDVLVLCRDMFDEVAHPSDPLSVRLNTIVAELKGDKS